MKSTYFHCLLLLVCTVFFACQKDSLASTQVNNTQLTANQSSLKTASVTTTTETI